ncbi:MAG: nitroreductase/quinone reductase family protein [Anaerolineales bacterium]
MGNASDDPALVRLRPRKPPFLIRRLLRIPVLLHRLGLGPVFGQRFLLLVHRGRRTGRRRYALLIVLHYDRPSAEAMVVAARGSQTNWLRNVVAGGAVEARIGRRRFEPALRLPEEEETYLRLEELQLKNRWIVRLLSRFARLPHDGSKASLHRLAAVFRRAAFRPRNGSGIEP